MSPATTEGLNNATKIGVVAAVMLSVLELPVSDASRFGVPPLGAVVSSVKLSEAAPVLPKAIGLARHNGMRTIGKAARRE